MFVFTLKLLEPLTLKLSDAVADPEEIREVLNPIIDEADMSNRLAPDPLNEPDITLTSPLKVDPLTLDTTTKPFV